MYLTSNNTFTNDQSKAKIFRSMPDQESIHHSLAIFKYGDHYIVGKPVSSLTRNPMNAFDKAINCWFYTMLDESDVPDHILKILKDNAIRVSRHKDIKCDRTLADCMVVPEIWLNIFKSNGIKCKIQSGFYISDEWNNERGLVDRFLSGDLDFPSSTDHNWLIIEEKFLFDPTACQFGQNIRLERYVTNKNKTYTVRKLASRKSHC